MLFTEILRKRRWCINTDRIGPDIPFTYWRLFLKSTQQKLCKKKFSKFADDAEFRPGAYAVGCSNIEIGKRVIIRPGSMLFGESDMLHPSIVIEDDVMIGCGVHFYINNHRFDRLDIPLIDQGYYPDEPIKLEKGCWIGANSIILPGVTVGANSVIGAGSIVTKSVPTGSVAVGNPAKVVKNIKAS